MARNIGASHGDGVLLDAYLVKGPVEGSDVLHVSVHIPMRMIYELEPPSEPSASLPETGQDRR